MKIEDILAPYQYDPRNPPELVEAFDTELKWFGAKRRAIVARLRFEPDSPYSHLFWRLENDDGAWCFAGRGSYSPRLLERVWGENTREQLLHRIHSSVRSERRLRRLYFLNEHRIYASIHPGIGEFYQGFEQPSSIFYLDWSDIKNWQCSRIYKRFELELLDQNSDAYCALQFLNGEDINIGAIVFGIDDPMVYANQLKQFESLMVAIFQCSNSLWQTQNHYSIGIPNRSTWGLKTANSRLLGVPLDERDELWVNLVKRYGSLTINEKNIRKLRSRKGVMSFSVLAPTGHERIEAQIKLFEWAKAHLPSHKYAQVEAMESQL